MRYFIFIVAISLFTITSNAQQKTQSQLKEVLEQKNTYPQLKAKKIYRTYKKKEGFKDAKIPRFLLAAARLVVRNDEANTILKAIQKARVLTRLDKGEGLNAQYYDDINNSISHKLYTDLSEQQKNLKIKVRKKKNNKIKEMALVTKTGPTIHYIFLKGNMKQGEADKFISNLNKAGIGIDKIKDKILDGIDKLLDKKDKGKQG